MGLRGSRERKKEAGDSPSAAGPPLPKKQRKGAPDDGSPKADDWEDGLDTAPPVPRPSVPPGAWRKVRLGSKGAVCGGEPGRWEGRGAVLPSAAFPSNISLLSIDLPF